MPRLQQTRTRLVATNDPICHVTVRHTHIPKVYPCYVSVLRKHVWAPSMECHVTDRHTHIPKVNSCYKVLSVTCPDVYVFLSLCSFRCTP
jgi:hypothetical protein